MRRILILDTETTGLDPATDRVVEVAAILYSVEYATPLFQIATLVRGDATNPMEHVNRIPAAALPHALEADDAWGRVGALADLAGAVVAHNADFDRSFAPPMLQAGPWVCSMNDIQWPKQTKPAPSLVALALEHDLGVATAHRAMADCELLARLFTRARELGADLDEMLKRAMRPKAEFVALVSYDDREQAKAAGFRWEATAKQWRRRMAIDDAQALPFKVRQVAA